MVQFTFIAADAGNGRVKSTDKKLVRSQCMQGKNKREGSRRSMQAVRKAAKAAQAESAAADARASVSTDSASSPDSGDEPAPVTAQSGAVEIRRDDSYRPSDFRILSFMPDDSNNPLELLKRFTQFGQIKVETYPIHNHLDFDDESVYEGFRMYQNDDLFYSAVSLTNSIWSDFQENRPLTKKTLALQRKTLNLLNTSLSMEGGYEHMHAMTYIVNILATISSMVGLLDETRAHLKGQLQLIKMMGGMKYYEKNPNVQYHFDCIDLSSALSTGSTPYFSALEDIDEIASTALTSTFIDDSLSLPSSSLDIYKLVDPRLGAIYAEVHHLLSMVNERAAAESKLEAHSFVKRLYRIQCRLISLRQSLDDVVSEAFRLGMLTYILNATYRMPENFSAGRKEQYPWLIARLREACLAVEASDPRIGTLLFWLLTVGTMAIFGKDDEEWVQQRWFDAAAAAPEVLISWEEARRRLEIVLWVPSVHDAIGKKAYEDLSRRCFGTLESVPMPWR